MKGNNWEAKQPKFYLDRLPYISILGYSKFTSVIITSDWEHTHASKHARKIISAAFTIVRKAHNI